MATPPLATPPEDSVAPSASPDSRNTWASGAFLAAAARLVARGEETTYTLRRVVEWATAATGARRAVLWAVELDEKNNPQLALLAWAAADGWRPSELPELQLKTSPALMRAFRTPDVVTVTTDRPLEQGADWDTRLGLNPIALCAAISAGETRGILAVSGLNSEAPEGTPFGDDARTALVACAALAAIVFERHTDETNPKPQPAAAQELMVTLVPHDDTTPATVARPDFAEEHESLIAPLPNRAAMAQRLGEEIGRARRFEHPLAVLLLTIDRSEQWADHLDTAGYAALRAHLLGIVRESIREVDLLGTDDDDALIVILPVSSVDDALRVGERIRTTLDNRQPRTDPAIRLRLTISGGAVSYPDDGSSSTELLDAAAHTATYARRMGRDQIRMRGLGDMESPSQDYLHGTPLAENAPEGSTRQIGQVFQALLDALIVAGDAHDQARPGHGQAVGHYAQALAEACGLNPDQVQTIAFAGALHDVGKIGLPADILAKRGELTPDERVILRQQPTVGKMMLLQIPALEAIIPLVEHAHERYDGNGYPAGLRGNQIPFGSRLIAIAEGYEAMINERPYRRALSQSMAIAEISREAGSRYDPQLVDTFVRLLGLMRDTTGEPLSLEPITLATSAPDLTHEEIEITPTPAAPDKQPSALASTPGLPVDEPEVDAEHSVSSATAPTPEAPQIAPLEAPEMAAPAPSAQTSAPEATAHALEPTTPATEEPTMAATVLPMETPAQQAQASAPPLAPPMAATTPATPPAEPEAPRRYALAEPTAPVRTTGPFNTSAPDPAPGRHPLPQATSDEVGGRVTPHAPTTGALATPAPRQARITETPAASEQAIGEASIEWYDDDVAHPDKESAQSGEEQRPDQLNVEDTILVMSQTTLLRMAELGRLNKRRTGYFSHNPQRDDEG